jgi:hypothetical protein
MAPTMTIMMVKMAQPLIPPEWCSGTGVGLGEMVVLEGASWESRMTRRLYVGNGGAILRLFLVFSVV